MHLTYKKPFLFCIWLLCTVLIPFIISNDRYNYGAYYDSDDYMRVVRVNKLVDGGGWYDGVIERENAPYGLEMHWTRFHDICILAAAAPFFPFFDKHKAVHIGASIIGAIFFLLIALMLYDIGSLRSENIGMISGLVIFFCIGTCSYVRFLRPDLHSSSLFLFTFIIKELLRFIKDPELCNAKKLGVLFGLALWDTEELILLIALGLVFVIAWYWYTWDRRYIEKLQQASIVQFVIVTLLVCGLERKFGDFRVEYDRISIVHVGMSFVQIVFFAFVNWLDSVQMQNAKKVWFSIIAGCLGLAFLLLVFPNILMLSIGATDYYVRKNFLPLVNEMRPSVFAVFFGFEVIAFFVTSFFYFLIHKPNRMYLFLYQMSCVYFILGASITRCLPYYEVLVIPQIASMIVILMRKIWMRLSNKNWMYLIRPMIVIMIPVIVYCIPGVVTAYSGEKVKSLIPSRKTKLIALMNFLEESFPNRELIACRSTYSAKILFFTKHSVVAGPYHRNTEGLKDLDKIFSHHTSDEELFQLLNKRGITLILVKEKFRDKLPHFLEEIKLPEGVTNNLRLYRLVKNQ